MTKVLRNNVKCIKCGAQSEQMIVHSVNFHFGKKEDNERLMNHKQICPACNYTAKDISTEIIEKGEHK